MKQYLERIFSEENLIDYGRACLDVAIDMSIRDIDTILIPSRGAFPIFLGAIEGLKFLGRDYKDFNETYGRLNPAIPVNGWLDKYLPKKDRKKDLPPLNILLVPFTADLNLKNDKIDDLEIISSTREYWSKVVASFFLPKKERRENIYFRSFTDIILRYIERREYLAKSYENFPQVKKIGLIDTVISGRASSTILEYMEKLGINPYSILVVDSNGEKLRTPFKQKLEKRIYEGSAKFIKTKNILSEDRGAALEGVIALIYSSLMIKSLELGKYSHQSFFYGAGSWHYPSPTEEIYSNNFNLFMNVVRNVVAINAFNLYCEPSDIDYFSLFRESRKKLLKNLSKHNFFKLKEDSVEPFNLNPELEIDRPYETSSHVLHVPFNDETTENVIEKLATEILGIEYENPYKKTQYSQSREPIQ